MRVDPATGKDLGPVMADARRGPKAPLSHGSCCIDTANQSVIYNSRRLTVTHLESGKVWKLASVRSSCTTGTVLGNDLAYVTPTFCRCGYALHGVKALGPAGKFDFTKKADPKTQLAAFSAPDPSFATDEKDWPTYRYGNGRTAASPVTPTGSPPSQAWEYRPPSGAFINGAVAAGALVFAAGRDGAVHALDAKSGKVAWKAFTAGEILIPPTIAVGRAYFGSADGTIYCADAATGKAVWRFRTPPIDRRIGLLGSVGSNWPVTSGILVEDGAAYAASGMIDFTGTHLYRLDAATGAIAWENHWSRYQGDTGMSAKGILASANGLIYMPTGLGGYGGALRTFSMKDGTRGKKAFRGSGAADVMVIGSAAFVGGYRLMSRGAQPEGTTRIALAGKMERMGLPLMPPARPDMTIAIAQTQRVPVRKYSLVALPPEGSSKDIIWNVPLPDGMTCSDAILAGDLLLTILSAPFRLQAFSVKDGSTAWKLDLPANIVPNGMIVDRRGQLLLTLRDGRLVCYR
jgi:outer membrane protein assembly factor BamB